MTDEYRLPPKAMSGTTILVVIGALIALGIVAVVFRAHQSCAVGIAGTDLQVLAQGAGAPDFCTGFLNSNPTSGYRIDQPDSSGAFMCQYTIGDPNWSGETVTVRDKGLLKLYGTQECANLASIAGG